jgi:poly-beta-1,6-N-acetyl-D-glucosamine biosynthesis protein PgaD
MKKDMIVDRPELKSELRKVAEGSITFLLWLLWSYFILPVINLILWFFGIRLFYIEVLSREAYRYFLTFLHKSLWIVLITAAVMLIWILYNYLGYRRRGDRRRRIKVVRERDIAAYFKVDPDTLRALKKRKSLRGLLTERSEARFK